MSDNVFKQINHWKQRAEKAEAACAEMRELILNKLLHPCCCHSVYPKPCDWCKWRKRINSSTCGQGWLSPEKAKVLVEALEKIMQYTDPHGMLYMIAHDALAAVKEDAR